MRYYRNSRYNYSCSYCRRGVDFFSDRCGSCRRSIGWGGARPGDNIKAIKGMLWILLVAFIWIEVIEPVRAYIASVLDLLLTHV